MNKLPKISEAEWEVMKLLWDKSPRSANEVVNALNGRTNWKPTTVKTLLSRLVKKKAVYFQKVDRTYYYYPLISRDKCVKAETQSFLQRVYGGALKPMLVNFLEEEKLTPEEIEDLKRLLERKARQ